MQKLQLKNNKFLICRGLTLVELMVTISIVTLIYGVTFGAMRIYDISVSLANQKSRLTAQANLALNKMREQLILSRPIQIVSITDNASGSNPPTPDKITFRIPLPDLDANQEIQWGDGENLGGTITYEIVNYTKDDQLTRHLPGALPARREILANDITDLQVSPWPLTGNSLTIEVTASKPVQRGVVPAISVNLSTTVDFKN